MSPVAKPEHRRRLAELLRAVRASNAFYQRKYAAVGDRLEAAIHEPEAFTGLPLLTKQELVDDQLANPPFGTNLTHPREAYTRVHQTSGTRGTPLRWLDTAESWRWWARCWRANTAGAR